MSAPNIILIGGNGYIGTALQDHLMSTAEQVAHPATLTVVDINDYCSGVVPRNDVVYIVAKYQDLPAAFFAPFDVIILLAGQGSVSNSGDGITVIDNNIRNFAWLLDILNSPRQKLVYASSSSVYGNTDGSYADETSDTMTFNFYDWSKHSIDELAAVSGKHYYGLRFGTVNGFSRNLRNDVMINSMVFNAKRDGRIFVSNAHVWRPILAVADLCRAVSRIIADGTPANAGIYNLASFNSTVGKIAAEVAAICGVPCVPLDAAKQTTMFTPTTAAKCYDFRIDPSKFNPSFTSKSEWFGYESQLPQIVASLLDNWSAIENLQNRPPIAAATSNYTMITACRVCKTAAESLLNLGNQPLANNYITPGEEAAEITYPLHLQYCPECFHVQLNCVVSPIELFRNYVYVSGTSKTLCDYFDALAQRIFAKLVADDPTPRRINVLEIACNDGSQLDSFRTHCPPQDAGWSVGTWGVDPAENIYRDISCHKTDHTILCEFFDQSSVDNLREQQPLPMDVIVAENVFAHIDDPAGFLRNVKQLMGPQTVLYLQTSQKNMIRRRQFDTAYHEHLSFFNTRSMMLMCRGAGLSLNNVAEMDIHGDSYLFEISLPNPGHLAAGNVQQFLDVERVGYKLYMPQTYRQYRLHCLKYRNDFNNRLLTYQLLDTRVCAFGSTAKSMTVFNFCGITAAEVEFMIDENPLKQGLLTPGSHIPVKSMQDGLAIVCDLTAATAATTTNLGSRPPTTWVIIVTAWNFYDEIKAKIVAALGESQPQQNRGKIVLLNVDTLAEEIVQEQVW